MKKYCLILVLALLLGGCGNAVVETEPSETFLRESSEDIQNPAWTETEILTAFYQYAETGTTVIGCVVVPDSQYGIVGVVEYTVEDEEGCCFDFLKADGIPKKAGVEALPAEGDTLAYAGGDAVTCRILTEDGAESACTLTYYEKEQEIGFQLVTE